MLGRVTTGEFGAACSWLTLDARTKSPFIDTVVFADAADTADVADAADTADAADVADAADATTAAAVAAPAP